MDSDSFFNWVYEGIGQIDELWERIAFLDAANQGSRCGTDLHSTPRHIATMNEFTETPIAKATPRHIATMRGFTETPITKEWLREVNKTIPDTLYTVEQLSIKRRNQTKRRKTIYGRMLDALDAGEPYEGLYGKIVDEMQNERQEESE